MINRKTYGITDALLTLRPSSQWVLRGDTFAGLEWRDTENACPTEEELQEEVERLQAEYDSVEYQRQRQDEYPPLSDQLDMLYWDQVNGTNVWQTKIDEIKTKYPKPV
jgi:hypothetical protein